MKEIRSIEIWFINNTYYLQAYSVSIDGVRYTSDNPIHVINQTEKEKLGQEIIETLKDCQFGIIDNIKDTGPRNRFRSLLGVKSEKELMKKGKSISVILQENALAVTSWYYDGKHLSASPKGKVSCSLNPEEITRTVLKAFERCHP